MAPSAPIIPPPATAPAPVTAPPAPRIQEPSLLEQYKQEPNITLPSKAEVEPDTNGLQRVISSPIAKSIGEHISLSGGLRIGGGEIRLKPSQFSFSKSF